MHHKNLIRILTGFAALIVGFSAAAGQVTQTAAETGLRDVLMWEKVNIAQRDLFLGPGGATMRPDLSSITFIRKETGGHNRKYRIKDGSGRIWVAKPGTEARPETASVRLVWALGYASEVNYLVPELRIPNVGKLKNVRLEARPENVKRLSSWKWSENPFVDTNELQGLKIMQLFLNNNDIVDINNLTVRVETPEGPQLQYIISDLGSTIGRFGNNNLPLFYRLGRKNDSALLWSKAHFIKGVDNGRIIFELTGVKNRPLFANITVAQGRWLADLLLQLSDDQIRDAFRAANYSNSEIELLLNTVKKRIRELDQATSSERMVGSQ